jgi:hypothetical protein
MSNHARTAALALTAAGTLLVATAAEAALIRVDFTVTNTGPVTIYVDDDGDPATPDVPFTYGLGTAGEQGSGYFVFDDALYAQGYSYDNENGMPTLDLAFSWNGATWDETSARIYGMDIQNGSIGFWGIGGLVSSCTGFPNAATLTCVGPTASSPDMWANSVDAAMRLAGGADSYFGSVAWSYRVVEASVPEPATLSLFALGLLGAGWTRRRR